MPIYWGDLHGHSKLSDGRGSPEEYYRYAHDEAHLDFCALTDEIDHAPASRTGVMTEESWTGIKQVTKAFHKPGEFVTFLGLKRPVPSWDERTPGTVAIYYKGDSGPLAASKHPPRDWLRPGAVRSVEEMEQLWAALKGTACLTVILHSGSARQGFAWSKASPKYAFDGIEVYSKWGSCEAPGAPFPISDGVGRGSRSGGTAHDALNAGFRLAFLGGSGTYFSMPGANVWENDWANALRYEKSGLTAVSAAELTREAVFTALKNRSCYATTGERIQLEFEVNGQGMGSVVAGAERLRLHARVRGTREVKRVEVFRNGEVAHRKIGGREEVELYLDEPAPAVATWYYARVAQVGEDYAWSSPVWVVPAATGS